MLLLIHIQGNEASFICTAIDQLAARVARERLMATGEYRTGLLTWIKRGENPHPCPISAWNHVLPCGTGHIAKLYLIFPNVTQVLRLWYVCDEIKLDWIPLEVFDKFCKSYLFRSKSTIAQKRTKILSIRCWRTLAIMVAVAHKRKELRCAVECFYVSPGKMETETIKRNIWWKRDEQRTT